MPGTSQLCWIGIMPVIADQCFIMTGDMETNPMQKLDGIQNLEIPLLQKLQEHFQNLLENFYVNIYSLIWSPQLAAKITWLPFPLSTYSKHFVPDTGTGHSSAAARPVLHLYRKTSHPAAGKNERSFLPWSHPLPG